MTNRPTPARGFLRTMTDRLAPVAPKRGTAPMSPVGTRGTMLATLATYGNAGVHAETLAVALWRADPAVWGMKRHPEHPDMRSVAARLSYLRGRGLVEAGGAGHRLTWEGQKAAAALATAKRAA